MKKLAPIVSYFFHPLIMPSLGLLIILNSGTYLALLDPAAKRALVFVMALGTLVFPLMMLPIIQYRSLVLRNEHSDSRGESLVPQAIILVLYIITYVYFKRLPVSKVIHAYALSVTISMLLLVIINLKVKVSMHLAALGGIIGLIIALIFLYQTPLQGFLFLSILAAGLLGTARLAMGDHWREILSGFLLGFMVILITLLLV
jgi:hypothetical protein